MIKLTQKKMINFQNISLNFGPQELLTDVSFAISKGEKIGLVGRNGSGKSTILKLITEQLIPDHGEITKPKRYIIGHLKQYFDFTADTTLDELCLELPEERLHEAWKAQLMLEDLGFSIEDIFNNPNNLSGGKQIKLNLAKLLFSEPDMLLLDEPTNYLDIFAIKWLKEFLQNWPGELVLITHDQGFMDAVITHTVLIHRGSAIKAKGNTAHMYEKVAHEEEIYEKTRLNEEKKRKETEEWINRFKAKASLATRAQSKAKMLAKQEVKTALMDVQSLDFEFNYKNYSSKQPIMKASNLDFAYANNLKLIRNLSFSIKGNDKLCIIGENGKGKSTLLNLLAGNLKQQNGEVNLHEHANMGFFGQTNIERLNLENSIFSEIKSAHNKATTTRIMQICGNMMFSGDLANKPISVLSGGEKSRVMLGKILLEPLNLILLDEPTNHLDMDSCNAFLEAMLNFPGAIIMVTHSEYILERIATKLLIFKDNKIEYFDGNYQDYISKNK